MTEIVIYPRKFDKEQGDEVRGLRAAECFRRLLTAARAELDDVNWRHLGLNEAEAALEAWSSGGRHGFFETWERRRGEFGRNRPAPGLTELRARRIVVLMCVALERAGGFSRRQARKFAAKELASKGVFERAPSHRAIEHWQLEQSARLTPQEEQFVATGIASCGARQPHRLAMYFIGLAHLVSNPAPRVEFER